MVRGSHSLAEAFVAYTILSYARTAVPFINLDSDGEETTTSVLSDEERQRIFAKGRSREQRFSLGYACGFGSEYLGICVRHSRRYSRRPINGGTQPGREPSPRNALETASGVET